MDITTKIKTTKTIHPQIYAYVLPEIPEKKGWVKIGYTEKENVHDRIKQQVKTAAMNLSYKVLWHEPAQYENGEYFKDYAVHSYLTKYKQVERHADKGSEWFFYNGTPEKSKSDFLDFKSGKIDQAKEKRSYQLRAEQEQAVTQTLNYASNHPEGEFLWNAKPRFGKTLTTYDFIRKMDATNVLIVTNRPAIAHSWFDDFETFIAGQTSYRFVSTSDTLKNRPVLSREQFIEEVENDADAKQIAFISLQDLKGSISFGGSHEKLKWVKDLSWDVLVIDESHEGVDTLKTDVAFNEIKRGFTLHLSGTPFKEVASGKFSEAQIYNWTYADEQQAKQDWDETSELNNPYEKLPKLNMFSYQMGPMIVDEVKKGANIDGKDTDYAFDLNEFFETNDSGKFVHEADVLKWLDSLTRNEKYPFSTSELRNELKHTFWLLDRVASAKALEKLLKKHAVFENYTIVLAAGDGKSDDHTVISEKALERVKKAIKDNEKTITLSVGQLTTGVTIPEWTAVLMLSNIQSPSLYMQAAFRAQNPWEYELNGAFKQKENAYVFDFAPERTLTIYDEFANSLSKRTAQGAGTSDMRSENIRTLLNFFPVIAEDSEGKMVELDVNQVLTIPKTIKAQEVVKRGFMSNLLFQNISGIFASTGAREILEQLNPVDTGKVTPRQTSEPIDTKEIELDDVGEVKINVSDVQEKTEVIFGNKVYEESIQKISDKAGQVPDPKISKTVVKEITNLIQTPLTAVAKEQGLTQKAGARVVQKNVQEIERAVEMIYQQEAIKSKELASEYQEQLKEASDDASLLAEYTSEYETKKLQNEKQFQHQLKETIEEKTQEVVEKSVKEVVKQAETNKKNDVEDDVRARLRGFTRTIPSFLMAYGTPETTLDNFDETIEDHVFKEVTGITLEQFRLLRDQYHFFDPVVFNESIQEFLNKKKQLANYFDETQTEDIFDYIPPQKTNQIFTPKKVVKMMVDQLEKETPGLFENPDKTFADLYVKSGLYLTEIVKRLYVGLEEKIPDSDERLKHILENQIYGFAPTEIIYNIARNFIFGFNEQIKDIDDSHIVLLDTTPYAKGETSMTLEEKCDQLFGGNDE
ncbi:DEAD/DEAH box helicase family protein [Vagococcus jeotgali]|uniref:DEAD/DEAH box helicase family protein n=1 Tax=Vagococcus jeotgali TaxID=3109030 RepID=UPI002DDAC105|nr:DEAD/DEAH box helicase family protein [Vagococcus sp. B2T-5]